MKRSLFAAALLMSTGWMIFPAHAQVEISRGRNTSVADRPHPDYDAQGIRLGAFNIYPEVAAAAEFNDNVFADNANKHSDIIFSVRPSLTAASNWGRHSLRASIGGVTTKNQDFSSEDVTDGYATADARLDLFHDSSLSFGGAYDDAHEPRTAAVVSSTGRLTRYQKATGYVAASTVLDRVRLTARADQTHYNYVDDPTQDYRDHDETGASLRAEYALSPDTAFVAQAGVNQHNYDNGAGRNSRGHDFLVGVNSDLTNLIRGEVLVGYTTQDFNDPAVGTLSGLAVRGRVEWFPTQITTVTFTGTREVDDSGVVGSAGLITTRAGVRVDHELRPNVLLTGGLQYGNGDYGGIDRSDDWRDADIGATYLMNRHVGIGLSYGNAHYTSSGAAAGRDMDVNRVSVSLRLKL
jgi:hypothetical protein